MGINEAADAQKPPRKVGLYPPEPPFGVRYQHKRGWGVGAAVLYNTMMS